MCIYCDYCVYHYKSTELVSLYTLDIGLKINIIIIIIIISQKYIQHGHGVLYRYMYIMVQFYRVKHLEKNKA